METFKVSVIVGIIFGFVCQSAEPQISQKLNLKENKSVLDVNGNSAFKKINTSADYNLDFLIIRRIDLILQKDHTIVIPAINYFDLTDNVSSFNYWWEDLMIKTVRSDYLITDTADLNWSSLILNPPSGLNNYYNRSGRISQSSFSDNILYRISGEIFNASAKAAYPSLSAPKK